MLRSLKLVLAAGACIVMMSCDGFPEDPAKTTQHVESRGTMRTGLIAGDESRERALAQTIAQSVGAEPAFETGTAEDLVPKLGAGDLDIVVGRFAKDSPWTQHAAFASPAEGAKENDERPVLRAVVRRGENRWLMLVERATASP